MLARAYAADALQPAGRRALRGAARRAGALRRPRADADADPPADRPTARAARALALVVRDALGLAPPEHRRRAPASSRRRSGSTPRTRARSSSCARPTARRAATGTACSRSPRRRRRAPTTAASTFLLAQAGIIAWRQLGNLIRARLSFERLSAVSPEHPQLRAFEAQIGETLKPVAHAERRTTARRRRRRPTRIERRGDARSPRSRRLARRCRWRAIRRPPPPAAPAPAPTPAAGARRGAAPRRLRASAAAPTATRRRSPSCAQLAEKQEAAKRYNEYVKTLLQLAALVPDDDEKVALYTKAADLYVSKFANQAEAVKAYEAVLAIDPDNAQAVDYLRQMYEKRRDWEKLLGLQRREAERMAPGAERAREVPRDREARDRAREEARGLHRPLAGGARRTTSRTPRRSARSAVSTSARRTSRSSPRVLERQAEITYDAPAKIQVLTKLGTIYGERLNNDEGAVNAWRALLTLDPNDRRAQDALKKKYLALGRWDDLEVFYAESGKWDEFIRVLEQQEAKETDAAREDLAPLQDRAALGGQEAEARSRRQGLREGARARAGQPAGRRGAHPDLHGGEQRARRSPTRSRSSSVTSRIRRRSSSSIARSPPSTRGKVKDPQKAFDRYLVGVRARSRRRAHERGRRARREGHRRAGTRSSPRTGAPSRRPT